MATTPIGSVSGLASGIQWGDMITQIMAGETAQQITPLTDRQTAAQKALDAWNAYSTAVGNLNTAAQALRDGSSFGNVGVSVSNSPVSNRALLGATATSTALPGTYSVGVLALASAQKLSGNVVSDPTAVLGLSSGQILVSGQGVSLDGTDTLNSVRDKINALNAGATPTHVSASILLTGNSARLVLATDASGSAGIDLRDARATGASASLLQQLGIYDGTAANAGTDGVVHSVAYTSNAATVSSLMPGVSAFPPPAAITVNGHAVTIDLQNQSLAGIAAAINAASPGSASVETISGATPTYRLNVSGTVSGGASGQPILEMLGLVKGTTGVVKQEVRTSNVLQDAGGGAVTGASTLLGLKNAGGTGAVLGDTFTITGTKADGVTPVTLTETVDGTKTVADMLADLSTAFSSTGRHVTADISDGRIRLSDDNGGDSGLSFSIAANNESETVTPGAGATLSFGASATDVVGRARELVAGVDSRITVNGVTLTRSSNSITDAIAGVTLTLNQAEAGSVMPVEVTRDSGASVTAIQNLAAAYNAVKSFVDTNTAAGAALQFNGALRASMTSIKNVLLTDVVGLPTGAQYTRGPVVGVSFDKSGVLQVDTAVLSAALASNPDAVKALYATTPVVTGTNFSYLVSGANTQAGQYTTNITQAATQSAVTGTATNFVYADGGTSDTMTILDSVTGTTGSIELASGNTVDNVVANLNGLFTSKKMLLQATNVGGQLKITSTGYGTKPSFTVSYTPTDGSDPAAQLGIAAGAYANGLNVAGNFVFGAVTYTATGIGQLLTGDVGTPGEGLAMSYNGTNNSATGTVSFALGIGGLMARIADLTTRSGDGVVAQQTFSSQASIDLLVSRQTDVQGRLDRQKASLTAQFTAMETALSKIQSEGTFLTNQMNALNSTNK